jgi:hypothetical protein
VNPPQQGIEEAREDKGKKGSESVRRARRVIAGPGAPAPQRAPAARGMSANRAVGPKHSYSTSRLMMCLRFVHLSQSL